MPGDAAPIVKIGLIAPFEGLGRPLGYALLPAVKVAVNEANAGGALGRYRVALVALNDEGDPATAVRQVKALALDPDVLAVLGPWSSETVARAVPALATEGLPALLGAPADGLPAGQRSLCPTQVEVAGEMIRRAQRLMSAAGGAGTGPGVGVEVAGPNNPLAAALRQATGSQPGDAVVVSRPNAVVRLYAGDAAQAADDLANWQAGGWRGRVIGGPDLARSWFIGRAGDAAEGSQAAVCVPARDLPAGFAAAYQAAGGGDVGPEAALAYTGARAALDAVAAAIGSDGRAGRIDTATALASASVQARLTWLQVIGGRWAAAGD